MGKTTAGTKVRPKDQKDGYDREFLLRLLREMIVIRRFEEKAGQMYGLRKIGGFCHLYNGQEGVVVGATAALDMAADYVLTGYRDHGHALACGMDPNAIMAELYGKATGCSRGKGGSMHMFDADRHMLGGNGIVASQIPVATGVAFAIRYKKENGVVLCFFGDGAIHQGAFHESLNQAKVWQLPIVYVCENNQYGMGTRFDRVSSVSDFAQMGVAYDIPGKQIDGMDVLGVYEEFKEAIATAKAGTPVFLEVRTYRYRGHSMSDPATYRTRDEVDAFRKQDPIEILKSYMEERDLLSQDQYKEFDQEARKIAENAVEFAESSEEPALEALHEDVLA
jgi:pyruvate dehydrogenase E1 component alpha subunit